MPLTTVHGQEPGTILAVADVEADAGGAIVRLKTIPQWGGKWWIILADGAPSTPFILPEGELVEQPVTLDASLDTHSVYAIPLGDWPGIPIGYEPQSVREALEGRNGTGADVEIATQYTTTEIFGDSGQLAGLTLAGLSRFSNCVPVARYPTRATLDVTLTDSAGTRTVTLSAAGRTVASGSRAGDGVITLAAVNDSGVTGAVTATYTADVPSGCTVTARWAAEYRIYSDGTLAATRADNGNAATLGVTLAGLTAGAHAITIIPISDTGVAGAESPAGTITVPAAPEGCGPVEYVSGGAADTVIRWWASPTAGASYQIYAAERVGEAPPPAPNATALAGAGWIEATLSAMLDAGAGTRRVRVHAVAGGVESAAGAEVAIEYAAAGAAVAARPPWPTWAVSTVAGRALSASWSAPAQGTGALPTQARLYLLAESTWGVVADWDALSPDATATVGASGSDGLLRGSLTATAGADGWYYPALRLAAHDGTLSDARGDMVGAPVWLGIDAPAGVAPVIYGAA